jgi:glycosyltransferase involved in cell wall biosynthesis
MLTPSFYPAIGGVETHVRRVSAQLCARGHQVSVVTHADQPSEERLGGINVYRLPRQGWWQAWRATRPHLAAADIVHCHDAYSYLHFCLPSWTLPPRRPTFITFHGYEGYPIPAEAVRRRRFVRRRVRNAICVGDFVCRWYHTSCFAVTYGGVDPVPNPPPIPAAPSALFVGRLADDTSIMLYLDALAILKREHDLDLPLTVAGDGPLRPLAQRFAKAQRLRVNFLGQVADPRDLFAQASFAFISGYLAIWQSLAMRRLVFAVYDNELKRDYLLGFPEAKQVVSVAPEADTLADQLLAHLSDPDLGDETRDRGAALAAAHDWDRVADLYLAMYHSHGFTG